MTHAQQSNVGSDDRKNSKSEELKANGGCPYSPDEFVRQRALGPKALRLKCHVFLGLGVKAGILDECVHKHPDVVLNLKHIEESALNTCRQQPEGAKCS